MFDDNQDRRLFESVSILEKVGVTVLQFFMFGDTERAHVDALLTAADIPPGALVLDAGCGTGAVAWYMGEICDDLNFILLNNSRRQLERCPMSRRFQRQFASMEKTGLPDQYVDFAMVNYAIGHAADIQTVLEELYRVLKPGGGLLICDMAGRSDKVKRVFSYNTLDAAEMAMLATLAGFKQKYSGQPAPPQDWQMDKILSLESPEVATAAREALSEVRPHVWRFVK